MLEFGGLSQGTRTAINQHHEPLSILWLIIFLLDALLDIGIVVKASVLQTNFIRHYEGFLHGCGYLRRIGQGFLQLLFETTFTSLLYETLLYQLNPLLDIWFRFSQLNQFLIELEAQLPATEPHRAPRYTLQILKSWYLCRKTPFTLIISLVLWRTLALQFLQVVLNQVIKALLRIELHSIVNWLIPINIFHLNIGPALFNQHLDNFNLHVVQTAPVQHCATDPVPDVGEATVVVVRDILQSGSLDVEGLVVGVVTAESAAFIKGFCFDYLSTPYDDIN